MLRLIGIIGTIISCGLLGIYKTSKLKMRIDLLDDYNKMILEIKGQINYFKEPLPEIFLKISQNNDSKAFILLSNVQSELDKRGGKIDDLWLKKASKLYENTPLSHKDLDLICYLGEFIGQTDYENQIQHFEYLEEQLKMQLNEANDNYKQKGPMYNKIGFFIGAIIAIIFI